VVLKIGENGRWKKKRCSIMQNVSVDSQDVDCSDDDRAEKYEFVVFPVMGVRGKPPHKLLAG
jgi:hypothetical protein